MAGADPVSRILVFEVPIRPAIFGFVGCHALDTGLERVIGPEATGQQTQSKFQMCDRGSAHRRNVMAGIRLGEKWQVIAKQRPLPDDRFGRPGSSHAALLEFGHPIRQIVLPTHATGAEKNFAGPPRNLVPP